MGSCLLNTAVAVTAVLRMLRLVPTRVLVNIRMIDHIRKLADQVVLQGLRLHSFKQIVAWG